MDTYFEKLTKLDTFREQLLVEVKDFINTHLTQAGKRYTSLAEMARYSPLLEQVVENLRADGPPNLDISEAYTAAQILKLLNISAEELREVALTESTVEEEQSQKYANEVHELQIQNALLISRLKEREHFNPGLGAAELSQGMTQIIESLPYLVQMDHPDIEKIIHSGLPSVWNYIELAIKYTEVLANLDPDSSVQEAVQEKIREGDDKTISDIKTLGIKLPHDLPNMKGLATDSLDGIIRHDVFKKVLRGSFFEIVLEENENGQGYKPLDENDITLTEVTKDDGRPRFALSVREYIEDTLDSIRYYICYIKSKLGLEIEDGEFQSVFTKEQAEYIVEIGEGELNKPVQFNSPLGFASVGTAILNAQRARMILRDMDSPLAKYPVEVREITDEAEVPTQETQDTIELYSNLQDTRFKYKTIVVSNFTTPEEAENFGRVLQEYKAEIANHDGTSTDSQGLKLIGITMGEVDRGSLFVQLEESEINGERVVRVNVFITYALDSVYEESKIKAKK